MDIGEYNWEAWSHEDLHAMINGRGGGLVGILKGSTGRGVAGGSEAADAWLRFTTLMDSLQRRTTDALTRAGVSWEGQASESARSGITPLAQWVGDAAMAGTATQNGTTSLVDYYSSARNAMPEPVPAASTANSDFLGVPAGFTHLLGGQTDQDRQERAAQEAKLEAVRVLDSYREHSATSAAGLGRFIPPPTVVTEIGVVTPEVAPVGETQGFVPSISGTPQQTTLAATPTAGNDTTTTQSSGFTSDPGTQSVTPPPSTGQPGQTTNQPPVVGGAPTTVAGSRPSTGATPPATGIRGPADNGSGSRDATGFRSGPGVMTGTGSRTGSGIVGRPGLPGGQPGSTARGGGSSGVLGEQTAARRGQAAQAAGAKGQPGAAMGPAGRGGPEEEDLEHFTPDYLNGSHDEFWGAEPSGRVAPPVIGE